MNKATKWFKGLSTSGKALLISGVAAVGLVGMSGATPPEESNTSTKSSIEASAENKPVVTTKTETEKKAITFAKTSRDDGSLEKGKSYIETAGVDGEMTITHTITLTDGKETARKSSESVTRKPVDEVTVVGTYVAPAPKLAPKPTPAPTPAVSNNCHPSYSGCVPNVSYDLDCADIGRSVTVHGYDQYRFDADNDGFGCESY